MFDQNNAHVIMITTGFYNIADYNERISSARLVRQRLSQFRAIANSTLDPEEKQRYQNAAVDAEKFLPLIEAQARSIATALGIDDSLYGQVIPPYQYEEYVRNGYTQHQHYPLGSLISQKA